MGGRFTAPQAATPDPIGDWTREDPVGAAAPGTDVVEGAHLSPVILCLLTTAKSLLAPGGVMRGCVFGDTRVLTLPPGGSSHSSPAHWNVC